jgi:hypothetical protein
MQLLVLLRGRYAELGWDLWDGMYVEFSRCENYLLGNESSAYMVCGGRERTGGPCATIARLADNIDPVDR